MARAKLYIILLVTLIVALALSTTIRTTTPPPDAQTPPGQRATAPDMSFVMKPGQPPVTLASMRGKVVLIDFWATWCGPCRESVPEVERIYQKYHDQGLEVVGISVDQKPEEVPPVVAKLGMTYPVVMADSIPDLRSKFKFDAIPQLYAIDRKGRVARSIPGADPTIEEQITPLLKE